MYEEIGSWCQKSYEIINNIRSVQCSNMLFSYKLSRSLTHPLEQQKVNPTSRPGHNDVIQHQQTFFFFSFDLVQSQVSHLYGCVFESCRSPVRLHAVVNLPLWDHTAGNQGSWFCPVHHLWFTQSWIEQHCSEKKFFTYKNLEIKMFLFFSTTSINHMAMKSPALAWPQECWVSVGDMWEVFVWFTCFFFSFF